MSAGMISVTNGGPFVDANCLPISSFVECQACPDSEHPLSSLTLAIMSFCHAYFTSGSFSPAT